MRTRQKTIALLVMITGLGITGLFAQVSGPAELSSPNFAVQPPVNTARTGYGLCRE